MTLTAGLSRKNSSGLSVHRADVTGKIREYEGSRVTELTRIHLILILSVQV